MRGLCRSWRHGPAAATSIGGRNHREEARLPATPRWPVGQQPTPRCGADRCDGAGSDLAELRRARASAAKQAATDLICSKGHLIMAYPVDNLPPIHPGNFLRRTRSAWPERPEIRRPYPCAAQCRHGDHEWRALDQRANGDPARPGFRHHAAVLDEPPGNLRPETCARGDTSQVLRIAPYAMA